MDVARQDTLSALWSTDAEGRLVIGAQHPAGVLPALQGIALCDWLGSLQQERGATQQAEQLAMAMRQGVALHIEGSLACADGSLRRVIVSGLPSEAASGGGLRYHGFIVDITAQRTALEAAVRAAAEYRLLIENATDLIAHCDGSGRYVSISPSYERLIGWAADDVVGRQVVDFLHPDDRANAELALQHLFQGGVVPDAVEVRKRHRDGHYVTVGTKACGVSDGEGRCIGAVLVSRDITLDKQRLQQLEARATRDALTGLPNRAWIHERVTQMLQPGDDPAYAAVLFIDLDGFKAVNDTLGHAAGDALLQQVAQRLQAGMRPGDAVARLGGDEFVVCARCADRGVASSLAQRLIDSLVLPFDLGGRPVRIGASIGIALARPGSASTELLFGKADAAMYKAKSRSEDLPRCFESPTLYGTDVLPG